MTAHPFKTLALIAGLLACHTPLFAQTDVERLLQERQQESRRLTRDAANPTSPLIATEAIVPDVDDLASRYKRTKAKLKPEQLAAYKPGPGHEALRRLGCQVLDATPMGAPIKGGELHMEAIAYRCANGAQGTLTASRNAPPDVRVELDSEAVTGSIANRPAVVHYFRAQQSRRLVIRQSWMAGPDHLLTLEYALPPTYIDLQRGAAWANAREMAKTLDLAYAPR